MDQTIDLLGVNGCVFIYIHYFQIFMTRFGLPLKVELYIEQILDLKLQLEVRVTNKYTNNRNAASDGSL